MKYHAGNNSAYLALRHDHRVTSPLTLTLTLNLLFLRLFVFRASVDHHIICAPIPHSLASSLLSSTLALVRPLLSNKFMGCSPLSAKTKRTTFVHECHLHSRNKWDFKSRTARTNLTHRYGADWILYRALFLIQPPVWLQFMSNPRMAEKELIGAILQGDGQEMCSHSELQLENKNTFLVVY